MLILWILIGSVILFAVQWSVYSRYWDRKLRIYFRFMERAVTEGDSVGLVERIENRKLLPLPIFGYRYKVYRNFASGGTGEEPLVLKRKLALPARRAVVNRAKINSLSRGVYAIGEVYLSATDLFYVSRLERTAESASSLTVYPAKIPVQKLALPVRLLLGSIATRRMAQEDPFALKAIRPYEIYDSPRIINWKASARSGELKVNQFDHTTDEALIFLLDMESGTVDDREEMLRLASSLSQLFLRRGVSVSLLANGRNCMNGLPIRVKAGADAGHQITVDETLAYINLSHPATESFRSFLAGVSKESLQKALPVVISADCTGESLRAFQETPGTRGGYFLSVNGDGKTRTEAGITLLNWDAREGEVLL